MTKLSSKLDWNRMLGFEQIACDRSMDGKLGAKVGSKPLPDISARIGGKVGSKPLPLIKLGAKIGGKPAA